MSKSKNIFDNVPRHSFADTIFWYLIAGCILARFIYFKGYLGKLSNKIFFYLLSPMFYEQPMELPQLKHL